MIGSDSARAVRFTVSPARRRGVSLIELMVVMTGVAVVLGLCAVTIQALMKVNADAQARLNASEALARLASQFREDVHSSEHIELLADTKSSGTKPSKTLRIIREPHLVVTYEVSPGRVARLESSSGKMSRHELFRVGKGRVVTFQRRNEGSRHFVALVISRESERGMPEPDHPLEVLALLGRDQPATQLKGSQPK